MKPRYIPNFGLSQMSVVILLAILSCALYTRGYAQENTQPSRGFNPARSYTITDIESIDNFSGNMSLNIPLASLPAGRGGNTGGSVGLVYNSKLYETLSFPDAPTAPRTYLQPSPEGGWRWNFNYQLKVQDRYHNVNLETYPQCPAPEAYDRVAVSMIFPDGSEHPFQIQGYAGYGGYARITPNGYVYTCAAPYYYWVYNTLTYYSTDGTYLRLDVYHDNEEPNIGDNPWVLYFPDGRKITFNEPGVGNGTQRFYDRNNNYIEASSTIWNDEPASQIIDQLGRSIIIQYDSTTGNTNVFENGTGGVQLQTVVKWTNSLVIKTYDPTEGILAQYITGVWWFPGVQEIVLPSQAGPLSYTFTYNGDGVFNGTESIHSTGYGEISSITLPGGAKSTYQYWIDNADNRYPSDILRNYVTAKTMSYRSEYDGQTGESAPLVSEQWAYNPGNDDFISTVTEPDGGITRNYHHSQGGFPQTPYKTEYPNGVVMERIWERNLPNGWAAPPTGSPIVNPYVKTEYRSIKNSAGVLSLTAIKNYNYDKNGNLTQIIEYDWVPYSSVPRGGFVNLPTGIPGGAIVRRVTANDYYNPTPDASNSTTDDPDVYHKASSPSLKSAVNSSEVRSGTNPIFALSRAQFIYDNPSTTGNLTLEQKWDSTKGGISRPLDAGNSISVMHQYDSYGNRTHTTDANNVTTLFVYGPVDGASGPENLYVTETKVAVGAATQQWTKQEYDLHTGLVKQSTDVDNNVTTRTTYDVFGRPTLVEAADGIAGFEKHTTTEYSDTQRRVIVRSDLNTTGDGKLITIQHYDQLGRIRLIRKLESGAPSEATDETKGIKIQSRYFPGDASNQNGYELVSAPYRAATSGAASGEPGMAWKRTKFDNGGRVIEVETFSGSTPPAPWGGNLVSSGKFTTEYDAEFTTVTDQAGKKRRSRMDALGRLVRVDEADAVGNLGSTTAPVQPTDYTYNALDNLIQTMQEGVPNGGSSPITQTRTFSFSSLGRLTAANNPESGPISYVYDANGNLKRKTDARGVYIDYDYDELNRNKTVDYSDTPVNPDITRVYDNPAAGAFGKGKFWKDYAGGDEGNGQNVEHKIVDGYDPLSRPLSVSRRFKNNGSWSNTFTTAQTYDLAGHVKTKSYPSGRSVTYAYDVSGDLTDFTGNIGDGVSRTYSTGIQYNPQGQMIREQFGTSTPLYHRRHFNSRGQLFDVRLGTDGGAVNDGPNPAQWTGASWNRGALRSFFSSNLIEYAWPAVSAQQNNGNLQRQDHFVPTALDGAGNITGWVMSADYYCYDTLNRVAVAAEETYTSEGGYNPNVFNQQFSYDRFGNMLVSSASGTGAPNPGYKINGAYNRLIAPTDADGSQASDKMQYDAAGNMIKDSHTQTGTAGARFYDAENRMLTADGANGLVNRYTYDADGHRTRRSINNGVEVWWQIYGISGELVGEYQLISGTPTLKKEYGYRNGQLLVIVEAAGTCQWIVTDALGTPRMIADQTGSLGGIKRRDYLPFGGELLAGIGHRQPTNGYSLSKSQQPRQQFTGKERDPETELDYFEARYYGSSYGRFTSPDEFTGGPDELYDFADNAGDNPLLYAEKGEPQSLNKYQYCYNNPLVYTDIDGHKVWDWVKAGVEVASWIPGPIGTVASVAQVGIALAEGDYKGAAVAALGVVPGGKLVGGAVKATAKALDKIGDAAKVVDKLRDVTKAAKTVGGACGLCFTAGTEVSAPVGLVKIEELRVGDKVTTTNIAKDKTDGWTAVDPKGWRVVKLLMPDPKGSEDVYEIELLRSLKWIREVGAAPRRWIEIRLPEMGLTGPAKVVEINASPKIKPGPGRVVLMTVTHMDQGVMEISFAGMKKALEPTASHPLFSEDRNDWTPAGQLRVGERIRTKTGTARIEAIRWKNGEYRVYNIEVETDHSYYVSMLELLSHNNSPCAKAFDVAKHGKQPTPRGGLQSHHVIQNEWAANNVTGYSKNQAPTILLPQKNHSTITTAQNARRDARVDSGQGKWSSTLRQEFNNASRDLRNAGVPDAARKKALKQSYKYFDELQ